MNDPELLSLLTRIADAIELLAQSGRPVAPNYTRPIEDYVSFDWSTINAHVIRADPDGATHVEWGGETWARRSPSNKFSPAIWYSRASGKDDDGNVLYLRLVTFKELKDSDPLPANVQKNLARPAKGKDQSVSAETAAAHPEAPAGPASTNGPTNKSVSAETPPQGSPGRGPAGSAGQAGATRANQCRRPEEVKASIQKMDDNLAASGKSATQDQVGLIASVLEGIFKDQEDQVGSRRKVLKFLTGNDSMKTIPGHMQLAVYMWLKPYKNPASGKWHAGLLADQEACAILQEGYQEDLSK